MFGFVCGDYRPQRSNYSAVRRWRRCSNLLQLVTVWAKTIVIRLQLKLTKYNNSYIYFGFYTIFTRDTPEKGAPRAPRVHSVYHPSRIRVKRLNFCVLQQGQRPLCLPLLNIVYAWSDESVSYGLFDWQTELCILLTRHTKLFTLSTN